MLTEIKELFRYFRSCKKHNEITFYSESGFYFFYYQGLINEILKKSEFSILYITSDRDDPVFYLKNPRIKVFYINKILSLLFLFVSSKVFVMTMTDLNNFHLKKTINDVNHIYVFHAINSMHMIYAEGAFDHYDTIFCAGPHHVDEIRKTEEIYNLPPKKLVESGYYWLETINDKYNEYLHRGKTDPNIKKIIIAPSWNTDNILETCVYDIVSRLINAGYYVIVRPHPEFVKRKKAVIDDLYYRFKSEENFEIDNNPASELNWYESDLLITDWSGISFEFAWGMYKPVIFIDTPMKIHNPEYRRLGIEPLEVRIRHEIGKVLKPDDLDQIDSVVSEMLDKKHLYIDRLKKLRDENIFNWGRSSEKGAEYIINYVREKGKNNNF